jgi:ribulose-5-phosphate 4-epimerase/fuculose-1-phosphate aldolase
MIAENVNDGIIVWTKKKPSTCFGYHSIVYQQNMSMYKES